MLVFSEIYQVTGPVARFARQIAGQGYIVAAPSSYHDFTGPEPLAYDVPGTDQGNEWKVKKVSSGHSSSGYLLSARTSHYSLYLDETEKARENQALRRKKKKDKKWLT